jgi:hypothetical protein
MARSYVEGDTMKGDELLFQQEDDMGDECDVMCDENGAAAQIRSGSVINPPPDDRRCQICRRHVDELECFGGPGDPLVGDFSGDKLVNTWREDYPGYTRASWECATCIVRVGGLWELDDEDKLGRPLSDAERHDRRYEMLLGLHEGIHLGRALTALERQELYVQLDERKPLEGREPHGAEREPPADAWSVVLSENEIDQVVRVAEKVQPAPKNRA